MVKSYAAYAALDAQIFLIVAALSIAANFLDWWSGDGDASMLTQHETARFEIGVWTMSLTVLRDGGTFALGEVVTYEAEWTWAEACQASQELSDTRAEPAACLQVMILQWLIILVTCFSFLAALAMFVSLLASNNLVMVLGVMLGAAGSLCALFGTVMPLVIQTEGLGGGGGFVVFVLAAVLSWAATVLAVHTATKAMPGPQEAPPEYVPRTLRAERSRAKTQEEHAHAMNSVAARGNRLASSRGPPGEGSEGSERAPPQHLQRVLFWSKNQDPSDVTAQQNVPTELLELAFQEIDEDNSGFIVVDELVEALHMCGLNAHPKAVATIISEMDANSSGDIDIVEFVDFFRQIEELARFQHKTQARNQFCSVLCNGCFLLNLVAVFLVIMVFIGMEEADDPDLYNLVRSALLALSFGLGLLFLTVIGLPALRLSLGSHVRKWMHAYEQKHRARKTLKPVQAAPVLDSTDAPVLRQAGQMVAKHQLALPPVPRTRAVLQDHQRAAELPGVITDMEGNFVRYDPAAFSLAAAKSLAAARPKSFTPLHVQDAQDPRAMLERGPPKALTNGANQWTSSPWTTTPDNALNAQAHRAIPFGAAPAAHAVEDRPGRAPHQGDGPPLPPGGPSQLHLEDEPGRNSEGTTLQSESWAPSGSAGRGTLRSEAWSAARQSMESDPEMLG